MSEEDISIQLPPHAYVPGLSPRHPLNAFDAIKASVTATTPIEELHKTQAFLAGRKFYDAGFFWECHDVLEAVWVHTRDPSPERDIVLALIQLSNARLKVKMRQPRAALRLCEMVEIRLSRCPTDQKILGLHVSDMSKLLLAARDIAKSGIKTP